VSGLPIHAPIFVEIRVRETRHGGRGEAIVDKKPKFFRLR